jgi:hypothetical protein
MTRTPRFARYRDYLVKVEGPRKGEEGLHFHLINWGVLATVGRAIERLSKEHVPVKMDDLVGILQDDHLNYLHLTLMWMRANKTIKRNTRPGITLNCRYLLVRLEVDWELTPLLDYLGKEQYHGR